MTVPNPMDLTGRTILVTGASSGIGRETCLLLSQLGARLVLVGRDLERLTLTARALEGEGYQTEPFDLNRVEEIPEWLKDVTRRSGELYGLVHAAGIRTTLPLRVLTPARLEETMHVNVSAAVALARGFRQKGVRGTQGSLVFISSVAGLAGEPGLAAYSASKGAVIALTRALALELAPEGLRVNCVAPGWVETPMTEGIQRSLTEPQFATIKAMHPLGLGHPRDVAHAVAFLLADTGRWITGTSLVVDGGYLAH